MSILAINLITPSTLAFTAAAGTNGTKAPATPLAIEQQKAARTVLRKLDDAWKKLSQERLDQVLGDPVQKVKELIYLLSEYKHLISALPLKPDEKAVLLHAVDPKASDEALTPEILQTLSKNLLAKKAEPFKKAVQLALVAELLGGMRMRLQPELASEVLRDILRALRETPKKDPGVIEEQPPEIQAAIKIRGRSLPISFLERLRPHAQKFQLLVSFLWESDNYGLREKMVAELIKVFKRAGLAIPSRRGMKPEERLRGALAPFKDVDFSDILTKNAQLAWDRFLNGEEAPSMFLWELASENNQEALEEIVAKITKGG